MLKAALINSKTVTMHFEKTKQSSQPPYYCFNPHSCTKAFETLVSLSSVQVVLEGFRTTGQAQVLEQLWAEAQSCCFTAFSSISLSY